MAQNHALANGFEGGGRSNLKPSMTRIIEHRPNNYKSFSEAKSPRARALANQGVTPKFNIIPNMMEKELPP